MPVKKVKKSTVSTPITVGEHICDVYKRFQPVYSASKDWDDKEKKKQQAILELVSEAGEVLALAQKAQRKGKAIDKDKVLDELGDTLWGLVAVMNAFDISWTQICNYNIKKLTDRNS